MLVHRLKEDFDGGVKLFNACKRIVDQISIFHRSNESGKLEVGRVHQSPLLDEMRWGITSGMCSPIDPYRRQVILEG